ncbi:helical backbone metal receptor [Undibacterium parvum]|uniref:Cobalamin-binding protein n=1 Tax=Undibacterium parvum TaxID=401471 RepID=A0A3S9HIT6_9BURK|nr:helical backbone metal receptor [Undibacterium parvum]AZP12021.1 cobalamin-binding protein [Undibacterium parvum]
MEFIDAIGQRHHAISLESGTPRILSLVPSITELLCDLGLAQYMVGRTGFCIHPKNLVKQIPKVGGTKDVDVEKIRQLAPTHLLVNIDENQKPVVDLLSTFIPSVIVTHPLTVRDNLALYRLLGGIFQVQLQAEKLCTEFELAYAELGPIKSRQRLLYCIWKDPWMSIASDTYISNMLSLIGWETWRSPSSQNRYPVFEWNADVLSQIDGVVLSSEPYRFSEKHVADLQQQLSKPVRLLDGEMLSWYGSRAIAGLKYLRSL